MTLFDSIRYPISDIPTAAELESLPPGIYYTWLDARVPSNPSFVRTPEMLGNWFSHHPTSAPIEAKILRQMILDYDNLPRD